MNVICQVNKEINQTQEDATVTIQRLTEEEFYIVCFLVTESTIFVEFISFYGNKYEKHRG